jgi:hypothetical protein
MVGRGLLRRVSADGDPAPLRRFPSTPTGGTWSCSSLESTGTPIDSNWEAAPRASTEGTRAPVVMVSEINAVTATEGGGDRLSSTTTADPPELPSSEKRTFVPTVLGGVCVAMSRDNEGTSVVASLPGVPEHSAPSSPSSSRDKNS